MTLVVDAGPLVAALDPSEDEHHVCRELLESWNGALVVPTLCLAEAAYFVGRRVGWRSEIGLLAALESAELTLAPVEPSDLARIAELLHSYRDLPLGTTDASVVAAAERLDVTTIATLDRRHFQVVRPTHIAAFELLP